MPILSGLDTDEKRDQYHKLVLVGFSPRQAQALVTATWSNARAMVSAGFTIRQQRALASGDLTMGTLQRQAKLTRAQARLVIDFFSA